MNADDEAASVSDMPGSYTDRHTCYAYNTKVIPAVKENFGANILLRDLDVILRWAKGYNMQFNAYNFPAFCYHLASVHKWRPESQAEYMIWGLTWVMTYDTLR